MKNREDGGSKLNKTIKIYSHRRTPKDVSNRVQLTSSSGLANNSSLLRQVNDSFSSLAAIVQKRIELEDLHILITVDLVPY